MGCDSTVLDPAFDMSSLRSELRVEDRPNVAQTEGGQGKHEIKKHSAFRVFVHCGVRLEKRRVFVIVFFVPVYPG